ncbi:TolC family protein [Deinococcus apachensis]|uniref:TolC family protein n=1 Tax=Deinococcus apachensis TaxID=309886 RepID=UPI00036A032A|nr:TolC family protein [Deinococcus apachensis]
MRSPPVLLLLSLALLAPPAAAQSTPPPAQSAPEATPTPLTLAQTLARLRGSPGWLSADLQYRGAELALGSARARAGVNVTVGVDASAVKVPVSTGETTLGATVTAQVSVSVLPWSPTLEAVRGAERDLARAGSDRRAAQLSATVNAVQAYYAARNAAVNLALAGEQVALAERQLAVAQAQRTAGTLPPEGLLARQGALDDARAAQRQAQANVDLAARSLANLLGGAVTLPTDPAAFSPLPAAPSDPGPLDALVARALTGRPEVARAGNDLADARARVQAAQLDARLPDLTASAQYGELAGAQGTAGRVVGASLNAKTGVLAGQISVPLRDSGERPTGLALGLSGSFPVVGGGKGTALASAEVGVQAATLALETARQSVDLEVRQRYADLQSARDSLSSAQSGLIRAQAALTTAQARLGAGLVTELDVQSAQLNVAQAQLALDNAVVNAYLASLRLSQSTTDLDPRLLTPSSPAPEARP